MKTVVIFFGVGYGLSPVLMTLTHTISTDTIYAMTAFMLLANLLFHDYINSSEAYVYLYAMYYSVDSCIILLNNTRQILFIFNMFREWDWEKNDTVLLTFDFS